MISQANSNPPSRLMICFRTSSELTVYGGYLYNLYSIAPNLQAGIVNFVASAFSALATESALSLLNKKIVALPFQKQISFLSGKKIQPIVKTAIHVSATVLACRAYAKLALSSYSVIGRALVFGVQYALSRFLWTVEKPIDGSISKITTFRFFIEGITNIGLTALLHNPIIAFGVSVVTACFVASLAERLFSKDQHRSSVSSLTESVIEEDSTRLTQESEPEVSSDNLDPRQEAQIAFEKRLNAYWEIVSEKIKQHSTNQVIVLSAVNDEFEPFPGQLTIPDTTEAFKADRRLLDREEWIENKLLTSVLSGEIYGYMRRHDTYLVGVNKEAYHELLRTHETRPEESFQTPQKTLTIKTKYSSIDISSSRDRYRPVTKSVIEFVEQLIAGYEKVEQTEIESEEVEKRKKLLKELKVALVCKWKRKKDDENINIVTGFIPPTVYEWKERTRPNSGQLEDVMPYINQLGVKTPLEQAWIGWDHTSSRFTFSIFSHTPTELAMLGELMDARELAEERSVGGI